MAIRGTPNPAAIVYPTTAPPRFACALTTRTQLAQRPGARTIYPIHDHSAFVDKDGNGNTDTVASHFHRVINGRVMPDESDGHTHSLSNLPCGAG